MVLLICPKQICIAAFTALTVRTRWKIRIICSFTAIQQSLKRVIAIASPHFSAKQKRDRNPMALFLPTR